MKTGLIDFCSQVERYKAFFNFNLCNYLIKLHHYQSQCVFMITSLKIIFAFLLAWMIYIVISTGIESSLFEQWNYLASIPWMRATLWDFYANVFVIYCWILYKETSVGAKICWLISMIFLGSIASCIYVLYSLFRLRPDEGIRELLIGRNN